MSEGAQGCQMESIPAKELPGGGPRPQSKSRKEVRGESCGSGNGEGRRFLAPRPSFLGHRGKVEDIL